MEKKVEEQEKRKVEEKLEEEKDIEDPVIEGLKGGMRESEGDVKLTKDGIGWEDVRENEEREGSEAEDEEREVRDREVEEALCQKRMSDDESKQVTEADSGNSAKSTK